MHQREGQKSKLSAVLFYNPKHFKLKEAELKKKKKKESWFWSCM